MKYIGFLLITTFCFHNNLYAQIGAAELYSGLNKTAFTSNAIIPIDEKGKFNFIGMGFYNFYHRDQDKLYNETGLQTGVFYSFTKDFKLGLGLYANSTFGLQQRLVMNYTKKAGDFFILVAPAFAINKSTTTTEMVVDILYEKEIANNWNVYVKAFGMIAYDNFNTHARNFQQPRIGMGYKRKYFGFFADFDQWGSNLDSRSNYGLFAKITF
ncbi:hypothetical protein GCM10010984_07490 [Chishuiella changwenlii]|nr:hypothetical protein [Chishuiella changwenlii]GGE92347.1 hypothetical protein GCM10010984_07490 [Chishuiella changwenlii]